MIRISFSASLALALAVTATAGSAGEKSDDATKLICKREKQTSTRFSKRTCMTKEQWDAVAEENRRNYSEMRDRPVIDTTRDS